MKNIKFFTLFLVVILLITACGAQPPAAPTVDPTEIMKIAVETVAASGFLTAQAKIPTATSGPTQTPRPTETPQPTETTAPTETSTPSPKPIILQGTGDSVVNVNKWHGLALIKMTHNGSSNFQITDYSGDKVVDYLVNEIGNYSGTKLLDYKDNVTTTRFLIKADGQWKLEIMPFSADYLRIENVPGTINGTGDDVIGIKGTNIDLMKSNYLGDSNFIVEDWTQHGLEIITNEIGPYTGTTVLPSDTLILQITATGPWTIEITGK